MPFFARSSGFSMQDGHMYEVGGDCVNIHFAMPAESTERIATQLLSNRKECDLDKGDAEAHGRRERFRELEDCDETPGPDGLMIVHPKDIDLQRQLTSGSNYRTHSAFHKGRVVAVKVFDGPRAKQSWKLNLTFAKNFLHSNVPKIVGISDENRTGSPFIVFHGISDRKMNSLLANALRTDLNKSVRLSMRTVKGLAAGLSYMESQNLLPKGIIKLENFDIFAGGSDEPVLSIHLSDTSARGPQPAYHPEDHRAGTEMLSALCQKLFTEVNSILYDDSPERELDADDLVEIYPSVVQSNREGHSNVAGDVSSPTEVRTAHKTPRREVRWQLDKSANNRSLESIVRRFEDYLDCVSASSADSPLRRITVLGHKRIYHRCPGYLREEITLTADVSRSVVVAHQYPSQSEICTICGQLVKYPSNPVPSADFEFSFDPSLPSSADLFSPAETTDPFGFLDNLGELNHYLQDPSNSVPHHTTKKVSVWPHPKTVVSTKVPMSIGSKRSHDYSVDDFFADMKKRRLDSAYDPRMAERLNNLVYHQHGNSGRNYSTSFNPRSASLDIRTPEELAAVNKFLVTLGREVSGGRHHPVPSPNLPTDAHFDAANLSQLGLAGIPGLLPTNYDHSAERHAIPLSSSNTYSHPRQDVPNIVNASAFTSSPASRTIGHLSNTLETNNVSSSKSPLIHDVIIHSPRRPPTSNAIIADIMASSEFKDLNNFNFEHPTPVDDMESLLMDQYLAYPWDDSLAPPLLTSATDPANNE